MRALRLTTLAAVLAVCLWPATVVAEEISIRPVLVEVVPLDPDDPAWERAPASGIALFPQEFVPPTGGGAVRQVEARSLYAEGEIGIRLEWEDKSMNATWDVSGRFTDACAVQFPLREETLPSLFMGEKGGPVEIWMWRTVAQEPQRYPPAYSDFYRSAEGAIENVLPFSGRAGMGLLAEGFGTLSPSPVQEVEAAGRWKEGRWAVVLRRKQNTPGGASLRAGMIWPVAFAVWDGERGERDGAKSLSLWHLLPLAPLDHGLTGPQGGERVFARSGCAACHGQAGRGGVRNPNAAPSEEVPPLTALGRRFTAAELKEKIRQGALPARLDPQGPAPRFRMPAWGAVLDESELDLLGDYLMGLQQEESVAW